jgi:protein SCO1
MKKILRLSTLLLRAPLMSLLLLSSATIMTACSESTKTDTPAVSKFHHIDITGAPYAKGFQLIDHHGKSVTLADYEGKVVILFFGYTQCPDVCPTTLSELKQVMTNLDVGGKKLSDKVQVLFITVDPERDTAKVLDAYMPLFDPRFIGLFGDAKQTQQVLTDFKIVAEKRIPKTGNPRNYTMDHSAGSYVFDTKGQVRLYVRYGQPLNLLQEDIQQLLSEVGAANPSKGS